MALDEIKSSAPGLNLIHDVGQPGVEKRVEGAEREVEDITETVKLETPPEENSEGKQQIKTAQRVATVAFVLLVALVAAGVIMHFTGGLSSLELTIPQAYAVAFAGAGAALTTIGAVVLAWEKGPSIMQAIQEKFAQLQSKEGSESLDEEEQQLTLKSKAVKANKGFTPLNNLGEEINVTNPPSVSVNENNEAPVKVEGAEGDSNKLAETPKGEAKGNVFSNFGNAVKKTVGAIAQKVHNKMHQLGHSDPTNVGGFETDIADIANIPKGADIRHGHGNVFVGSCVSCINDADIAYKAAKAAADADKAKAAKVADAKGKPQRSPGMNMNWETFNAFYDSEKAAKDTVKRIRANKPFEIEEGWDAILWKPKPLLQRVKETLASAPGVFAENATKVKNAVKKVGAMNKGEAIQGAARRAKNKIQQLLHLEKPIELEEGWDAILGWNDKPTPLSPRVADKPPKKEEAPLASAHRNIFQRAHDWVVNRGVYRSSDLKFEGFEGNGNGTVADVTRDEYKDLANPNYIEPRSPKLVAMEELDELEKTTAAERQTNSKQIRPGQIRPDEKQKLDLMEFGV
jgi:hypothetical protein